MNGVADPFAPEALRTATLHGATAGGGSDASLPPPALDDGCGGWFLLIPGEPVAKGRPKLGTVNGHAMAFTPKKTRSYESIVRETAVREWKRPILQDVPIIITVTFYRGIAASWPKKKRAAAIACELRPTGRPDLDNMVKAITDGLNGVVYLDDSLIVETRSAKFYAEQPRVELTMTWGRT